MAFDTLVGVYNGVHFNGSFLQWLEVDEVSFENTQFGGSGKGTFRARYGWEESFTLGSQFTGNINAPNRIQCYLRNDAMTTSASVSASSISVANPSRFSDGMSIVVWDGVNTSTALITNISGSTLTLSSSLSHAFAANTNVLVLRYTGFITAVNRDATTDTVTIIEKNGYQTQLQNYITSFSGGGKEAGWCMYQLLNSYAGQWDLYCTSDWVMTSSTTGAISGSGITGGTLAGYYGTQTTATVQSCAQDIITFANANPSENNYTLWVDVFGGIHFSKINDTTPSAYCSLSGPYPGFSSDGIFNDITTLQMRDEDLSNVCNEVLVQGGSDGNGNQITAIVVDQASINLYGTFQCQVSQTGLTSQAACAAYGQSYLQQYAFPRQTSTNTLGVAGNFLTAQDYVQISGFKDSSTLLTNIQTVTTEWKSTEQGQFSQTIQGQQLFPNASKLINQIAGQKYVAAVALANGSTNVHDRYVITGVSPSFTPGTNVFNIALGSIGCLVQNVGLDIFSVPAYNFTPSADGTYTLAWLYRNTDGTLYSGSGGPQWVYYSGTTVSPSASYTQYQILPLFTVFRYGGIILSYTDLRVFGGINISNLNSELYSAPTLGSTPTPTPIAGTPGLSTIVTFSFSITNVPQDYGCSRIAWLYRTTGAANWTVDNELPLTPFPLPNQTQTVAFGYSNLTNGGTYDFAIAYVGFAGQINIASGLTELAGAYAVPNVAIVAPYMLSGVTIQPTFSGTPSAINENSPNGISAAVQLTLTINNQPTNGSLEAIVFYAASIVSGTAGPWQQLGWVPAYGLGSNPAPSLGSYTLTYAELTGGTHYNLGVAFQDVQGGFSTITTAVSSFPATTLVIPSTANATMPTALKTNGPNVTIVSATLSGQTGGSDEVTVDLNINDTINVGGWFNCLQLYSRVHGTAAVTSEGTTDQAGVTGVTFAFGSLGAGKAYDLGLAYEDMSSQISTIVWPSSLSNITASDLGPGGIIGSSNQNIVPDSGFDYAPYNSSGIAGSDSGYWHFNLIDGLSYYLLRPAANTASTAANVMWWTSGASGSNRYGVSNKIYVTPGQTYCVSSTCDATHVASGTNLPMLAIASVSSGASNTYGSIIAQTHQSSGTSSRIQTTFTAPTSGSVVLVMSSNNCTINSGGYMNMAQPQIELGTTFSGYKPGVAVLPSGTITHTASSAETQSVISTTSTPGAGSLNVAPSGGTTGTLPLTNHASQVTTTITSTAGSEGSFLESAAVARRHIAGNTTFNFIWNPTAAINTSGWSTYDSTGHATFSRDTQWGGRFIIVVPSGTLSGYDSLYYQYVTVLPSTTYTFSGNFYCNSLPSGGAIYADVFTTTSLAQATLTTASGVLTPFTMTFTTPSGITQVEVRIRTYTGGTSPSTSTSSAFSSLKLEFGSVSTPHSDETTGSVVTATHTQTPGSEGSYLASGQIATRHLYGNSLDSLSGTIQAKNLVVNGNNTFGSGTNSPTSFGWTQAFGSYSSFISAGNYLSNTCFELSGTNNCGIFQDVPVVPGATYTFQCLVYTGTASYYPGLWCGSADGAYTQFNGSPGTPQSYSYTSTSGPFYSAGASTSYNTNNWYNVNGYINVWVLVYGTFTVPSGYNKMRVMLYNSNNIGASTQCFYYGIQVYRGTRMQDYVDQDLTANGIMLGYHATNALPYGQHDSAITNVVNSGGTYNANLATGLLPLANHNQMVTYNTNVQISCSGQMPYMSGTTLHVPSTVLIMRSNGDYCRVGAGNAPLGTTTGYGAWYCIWNSGGTSSAVGYIDYNNSAYQSTITNPLYQVFGFMQYDNGYQFMAPWVSAQHVSMLQTSFAINGTSGVLANASSFLNNQLSLNTFPNNPATMSATSTTTTVSWNFNIYYADGTVSATITGSKAITSSANTTYYANVWFTNGSPGGYATYYQAVTGGYVCISWGTSSSTNIHVTAAMNQDGSIFLAGYGFSITTPSSGSQSGGGGNPPQCPAAWQLVETQESGFIRADMLQVGQHVRDSEEGWNEIKALEPSTDTLVKVETLYESFTVDISHLWLKLGGDASAASADWIRTSELTIGTLISGRQNGEEIAIPIKSITNLGYGPYIRIQCERNRLMLGQLVAHNFVTV